MSFPNCVLFLPGFSQCLVSILVLVDVLPERACSSRNHRKRRCFNPCFSGCPSRTFMVTAELYVSLFVSILVLVDVLPEPKKKKKIPGIPRSFNPCFSGCPSRTRCLSPRRSASSSFNPCFSGCPSRTHMAPYEAATPSKFQSLF